MGTSIRGRLVASYVLVTLVTAAAMGLLAIWLIDRYVEGQEEEYLSTNAKAIAAQSLMFVRPFVARPALQQLAQSASFLGNAQVRILDAGEGVLADLGARLEAQDVAWVVESGRAVEGVGMPPEVVYFRAAPVEAMPATVGVTLPRWTMALPVEGSAGVPAPESLPEPFEVGADVIVMQRSPSVWGDRLTFEPAMWAEVGAAPTFTISQTDVSHVDFAPMSVSHAGMHSGELDVWEHVLVTATGWISGEGEARAPGIPAGGATAMQVTGMRSVTAPIYDGRQVAGYVELRRAGGYAEESLPAIRQAFAVAAGGALLLASVIGLVVSRGLTAPVQSLAAAAARMRGGDLAARAPVHSRDELGSLAEQFNLMAERLQGSFRELAAERDTLRRFVADASHELRTPITALRTFHELLLGEAGRDGETKQEFLVESSRQIERLEWITRNLLDLSRLDGGLAALDLQAHEGGELLEGAAAPFRAMALERGIALVVEDAGEGAEIVCDGPRIERALCNLLDNALKFTPCGGVVTARVQIGAGETAFEVEDTGVGIAAEELPHIFERFHRGRRADLPGSGLGLAIVQSVAQAHGGTVEAMSEVGVGSRFVLRLPRISVSL